MTDCWTSVLEELRTRFPFLERMKVSDSPSHEVSVPGVLQVATAVAAGLGKVEAPGNRAVLVFPRAHHTATWLAIGSAVATVQQEWRERVNEPLAFVPSQKLYIDDRPSVIVEFEREVVEDGERHFYIRTAGGRVRISLWKRFRFRPTQSSAKPVQAKTFLKHFNQTPPTTVLEHLTDSSTSGNDRVVTNGVILVTRLATTHHVAQSTRVVMRNGQLWQAALEDLFLWGTLASDGQVNPWGSGRAASDPLAVVTHLPGLIPAYLDQERRRHQKPLVILDGVHPLLNATTIVQELLDRGLPILAVLEDSEWGHEVRELLELSDFAIWRWSGDDLRSSAFSQDVAPASIETPFSALERSCRYMARQRQETERCADDGQLSSAAENLVQLRRKLGADTERMDPLLRSWYGILLSLSRLLRPLAITGGELVSQEERTITELARELSYQHLAADARPLAQQVIHNLQETVSRFRTGTPKINGFEQVLERLVNDGLRKGVVVLSDRREVETTAAYWQPQATSRWPGIELRFVTIADVQDIEEADFLIIAGWMGHERMFRLLHSHAAPVTVILAYPFEVSWHASAARRWERQREPEAARPSRARLLGLEPEKWPIDPPVSESKSTPQASPSGSEGGMDFEIQLDRSRRQGLQASLSSPGSPDSVEAWCIRFTDGSYGCFTLDRRLLVVSDLTGRSPSTTLPQRTVDQLQIGDLVAFVEGADSDVLRRQADVGLRKAGLGQLREISGLWRTALRKLWQIKGGRLRPLVDALAQAGCRRTPLTVRNWITTDHTIGPDGNEADLRAIVAATGDAELQHRLQEVVRAIETVRSAHLQASGYLHRELTAALPRLLSGSRQEAKSVEVEGVGRLTIVEIESLDREAVFMPEKEANRRHTEG